MLLSPSKMSKSQWSQYQSRVIKKKLRQQQQQRRQRQQRDDSTNNSNASPETDTSGGGRATDMAMNSGSDSDGFLQMILNQSLNRSQSLNFINSSSYNFTTTAVTNTNNNQKMNPTDSSPNLPKFTTSNLIESSLQWLNSNKKNTTMKFTLLLYRLTLLINFMVFNVLSLFCYMLLKFTHFFNSTN